MTNKEKFLALVSENDTQTISEIKERIKNRAMLKESGRIATKVLYRLDTLGWSQKDLAAKMNVSPQQVNKIVRGKENLTLETMVKLQDILEIPILASVYEKVLEQIVSAFQIKETKKYKSPVISSTISDEKILFSKKIKMDYNQLTQEYQYYEQTA